MGAVYTLRDVLAYPGLGELLFVLALISIQSGLQTRLRRAFIRDAGETYGLKRWSVSVLWVPLDNKGVIGTSAQAPSAVAM